VVRVGSRVEVEVAAARTDRGPTFPIHPPPSLRSVYIGSVYVLCIAVKASHCNAAR